MRPKVVYQQTMEKKIVLIVVMKIMETCLMVCQVQMAMVQKNQVAWMAQVPIKVMEHKLVLRKVARVLMEPEEVEVCTLTRSVL